MEGSVSSASVGNSSFFPLNVEIIEKKIGKGR